MNAVARLIFSSSRFQHIAPLLCQLHWLKAPDPIAFKQSVLVYKCLHGSAPAYLTDELYQVTDVEARQRLRSSSSSLLIVSRTQLLIVGDRAFPVGASCVWNSLPDLVTFAPSVAVFRSWLKTHLFNISYPCDCTVTLVALDTIIVLAYLNTTPKINHHAKSDSCKSNNMKAWKIHKHTCNYIYIRYSIVYSTWSSSSTSWTSPGTSDKRLNICAEFSTDNSCDSCKQ